MGQLCDAVALVDGVELCADLFGVGSCSCKEDGAVCCGEAEQIGSFEVELFGFQWQPYCVSDRGVPGVLRVGEGCVCAGEHDSGYGSEGVDHEVPQVLFRLSRWENLERAKEI